MSRAVVFIYNADGGLFSALSDVAHRSFSPKTYQCNLCKITYGLLGMRKEWKRYLEELGEELEFLHRDELAGRFPDLTVSLPAVVLAEGNSARVLVEASAINACSSVEDLKGVISESLAHGASEKPRG